ncbi:MAG TPA: hypothetical protein VI278_08330 [Nitrososphaeraceae archaeon]|jgi:hypothetical protein
MITISITDLHYQFFGNSYLISIAVSANTTEKATTTLEADLTIPNNNTDTKGIVLFAHGIFTADWLSPHQLFLVI